MNIFEEIKSRNIANAEKLALAIRLEDGTQRSYTFQQMFDTAELFCEVLARAQLHTGDRVAIVSESCPEWNILYIAIAKLNATSVLLDASLGRTELLEIIRKSDVRCLYASPTVIEKLGGNLEIPVFNILLSPTFYLQHPQTPLPPQSLDGEKTAASIIYSSGTTKKASGILHTHASLLQSAQMCMKSNRLKSKDRFLAILPNSHIYGLVCQLIGPLLLGTPTCFLEELNSSALVSAFQEFRPSIFPAVPKMYELLKTQILQKINIDAKTKKLFEMLFPVCLKLRRTSGMNLGKALFKKVHDNFGGNLRILCSAGAPLIPETADFFYGLGFDLLITYGATETCIPTIGNITGHITTDTCGKPYPGIAVKISENGEILIRTPYRMLGYFNDAQATEQAFDKEGWFRSGDLGLIDEKGCVRVLGRCKENIVLATGKKVAPDDIESAYDAIDGVKELVVCGIPIEDGSYDEVHAFVIAETGRQEDALKNIKERSARASQTQKLAGIHFLNEIPKTSLQKPKRFLLKKMISEKESMVFNSQEQGIVADIPAAVKKAIARVAGVDMTDFTTETKLFEELAIDSLGALDLACEIDERCGVKIDHRMHRDMTVRELIECVISPAVGEQQMPSEPYPKRKIRLAYNIFCIFRNLCRGIYRVKIKNDIVLPKDSGYIICANHVSNFDYLFLTLNFTKERFTKFCCMAKKELFQKNWLSKTLTNICGMIPVDRCGLVTDAMSDILEKLKEKWGVLIHPEGTRSKTGNLGDFKNGAAVLAIEAGVPIVPAYIKGGYEVYPCWKKLPQIFDWKRMRKYQVDVIYGAPISPNGMSPEELTETLKIAMTILSGAETLVPAV